MKDSSKNKENLVLNCTNLKKNYNLGDMIVQVLRGLNLQVNRGQMIAIMGPSGSGKTTLINLLGGLDQPSEGMVELGGIDVSKMTDKELIEIRRHKIGFIFQKYSLLPTLSAFENIELPMLIAGLNKKDRHKRTNELLAIIGLIDRKHHKPHQLSGGEKQRISIARALANRPAILLCDELTGDLDSKTGKKVIRLLKKVNKKENQTIIIVTHDQGVANQTEIIYHLKDGQIWKIEHNEKVSEKL